MCDICLAIERQNYLRRVAVRIGTVLGVLAVLVTLALLSGCSGAAVSADDLERFTNDLKVAHEIVGRVGDAVASIDTSKLGKGEADAITKAASLANDAHTVTGKAVGASDLMTRVARGQ